jgi:membrane associated rhomboid family serine protease
MARPNQWQGRLTFGGRLPWTIGLLLSLTVILSLFTAIGDRRMGGLFQLAALVPGLVLRGQLWRLLTWLFVEGDKFALLMACLSLFWFGVPLSRAWGSRRFLLFYVGLMVATAIGTCLIAIVDSDVRASSYLGGWPIMTGLVVAWGFTFPTQVVRIFYFLIPIQGIWFAWGAIALTVVTAAYSGLTPLLPELLSEAAVLAWVYRVKLLERWWGNRSQTRARAAVRRSERGVVVEFPGSDRADSERKPN